MAYFFSYDQLKHKHRIYVYAVKNEKDEVVGYRPIVERFPVKGGVVEKISDYYPQFRSRVWSTEELAREFAYNFFEELPIEKLI